MACTPYLVPSVRSKRTGCRLAVAQGEGIGAELLKEATKNCERCSASHKCEAEMLWEHMDATLAEPSACQNDAEALQLLRTHQWGPSWLATQRFVSLARSMTERGIKKMRFKSNGNYPNRAELCEPGGATSCLGLAKREIFIHGGKCLEAAGLRSAKCTE